jgi:hypothetical protein
VCSGGAELNKSVPPAELQFHVKDNTQASKLVMLQSIYP